MSITLKNVLFSALTLAVAGGCTTKFAADFEADTAGALPLEMPAGPPDDRIYILPSAGSVTVSNSSPLAGTKSLRFRGPVSGSSWATALMYAETLNNPDQRVYGSFAGRMDGGGSLRLFFFTGHFSTMVTFILRDGQIIVNDEVIGDYEEGERHTVLMNANPADDSYSLSFVAPSGNHTASGTVANPGVFPRSNIGFQVQLFEGGSAASYRMDTIRMSERRPDDDMPSG
jgi:hypothetical protein